MNLVIKITKVLVLLDFFKYLFKKYLGKIKNYTKNYKYLNIKKVFLKELFIQSSYIVQ